jgi:hypothetical protein
MPEQADQTPEQPHEKSIVSGGSNPPEKTAIETSVKSKEGQGLAAVDSVNTTKGLTLSCPDSELAHHPPDLDRMLFDGTVTKFNPFGLMSWAWAKANGCA